MSTEQATAGWAEIDAALLLLSKLGLTAEDLLAGAQMSRPVVPTFAEFVPQVIAATTPGTLKAYGTYWNRVVERWGTRTLDEPTPLEIEQLGKEIRALLDREVLLEELRSGRRLPGRCDETAARVALLADVGESDELTALLNAWEAEDDDSEFVRWARRRAAAAAARG